MDRVEDVVAALKREQTAGSHPLALRARGDRRGGARLRERTRVEATRAGRKGRQLNAI